MFPFEHQDANTQANPFAGRVIADAVGSARVTQVSAGQCRVKLDLKEPEDRQHAYYAVVVSQPMPPTQVVFEGDPALLAAVRNELGRGGIGDDISLVVQETTDLAKATLRLIAADGAYQIRRASDAYAWTVPASDAPSAAARLAHVARWLLLAKLENTTSQLPANAVRVELHRVETVDGTVVETPVSESELTLAYRQRGDKWERPSFKLTLHNTTGQTLYCAVLDLTEAFGVSTAGLFEGTYVKLEPQGKDGSSVPALYKGSPHIPNRDPRPDSRAGCGQVDRYPEGHCQH